MDDLGGLERAIKHPMMAGGIGAFLAAFSKMIPGATWYGRAFNFLMGLACAVYLSPAIARAFGATSDEGKLALAFFTGLFGVVGVYVFWEQVKAMPWPQIWEWALSWLPRRGG